MDCDLTTFERMKSEIHETGFACIENPFGGEILSELTDEARTQRTRSARAIDDGEIPYRSRLSDLGEKAEALLNGSVLPQFLFGVFSEAYRINLNLSCYTFYEEGDFLSAHLDPAGECDVTLLIYLQAVSKKNIDASPGMYLEVYNDLNGKPGKHVRSIRTNAGQIVIGRGSRQWHGRKPLAAGEKIAMVSACFAREKTAM